MTAVLSRLAEGVRRLPAWLRYVVLSLVVLTPCYWQARVQAGDLSSHIYNAWLAQLIESGKTPGLVIVKQSTNVLFDLMLSGLLRLTGPAVAQRVAVSVAVLVFFWGAFAFLSAVSGRRPWGFLPWLGVLTYGWVFHIGFFNFYLSLGLCCGAMAIAWDLRWRRLLLAAPLLALACVAHALPVGWSGGLLLYVAIARRIQPAHRLYLTAAGILAMIAAHVAIAMTLTSYWSAQQLILSTGFDQVWVFSSKYFVVLLWLALAGALVLLGLARRDGVRAVATSIPFQLCALTSAAILVLPSRVLIPGFLHTLGYVSERMSLAVALCVCAFLASARLRVIEQGLIAGAALLFFGFLYLDEKELNRFEDRIEQAVAQMPPGHRVVSPFNGVDGRINPLTHMIDRACLGRCFSYANYEASTAQFRIRVTGPNAFVAPTYADSWQLQIGEYVVKERDLPLYVVDLEPGGRMAIHSLKAGSQCGSAYRKTAERPPNS